jgi:hypothetical protein
MLEGIAQDAAGRNPWTLDVSEQWCEGFAAVSTGMMVCRKSHSVFSPPLDCFFCVALTCEHAHHTHALTHAFML